MVERESSIGQLMRYLIGLVRRNIWLIVIVTALAVIAAVVLTMLQTPRYTAMSTIEIAEETQQVLGEDLAADTNSYANWDIEMNLNTQLEILRSRALAERVAGRLDLATSERFFNAMEAAELVEATEQDRHNAVVGMLRGNFNVDLPTGTRIAELAFTSTDAGMSAMVVDAFAQEFIQANLQRKFDSSAYARSFVAEQLEEARVRLENSERELNAYAREAGLIRTRDAAVADGGNYAGSMTASSLLQLNEAANQAQAARITAQARWDAERAQPLFSSQAVLESPTVQALMQERATQQANLDAARQRYLPDHPAVARIRTQLQATETSLNRAANEVRNSIRANYQAAATAETNLRQQVNTLEGDTLAEQDRSVRYNTLAREADTNRQIYDGLLQRYRALNAAAGITASNIAVVDRAEVPTYPSSPNLPRNVLLAMVLGLALAGAVVFLRDQMDDRLRVPEDVESKIGLPLLGVVPTAEGDPRTDLDDPKSPLAESYNALRTALMHSTREGLPRLLLVTSAQASEGKTTTSYAVARSFARVGKSVLLMDADLRRPNVHKMADVPNRTGLSSLLVGEGALAEAAVPSAYPGLTIMPAGPIPPSPAELLSSPRMAALLEQVEREYDFVVIDSAPILGLADSTELSTLADGVMLVVEANRGRGGQLKGALRRLRSLNPVMVGAVLTKYDPSKGGSYSYYGYNYYRYESDENAAA